MANDQTTVPSIGGATFTTERNRLWSTFEVLRLSFGPPGTPPTADQRRQLADLAHDILAIDAPRRRTPAA